MRSRAQSSGTTAAWKRRLAGVRLCEYVLRHTQLRGWLESIEWYCKRHEREVGRPWRCHVCQRWNYDGDVKGYTDQRRDDARDGDYSEVQYCRQVRWHKKKKEEGSGKKDVEQKDETVDAASADGESRKCGVKRLNLVRDGFAALGALVTDEVAAKFEGEDVRRLSQLLAAPALRRRGEERALLTCARILLRVLRVETSRDRSKDSVCRDHVEEAIASGVLPPASSSSSATAMATASASMMKSLQPRARCSACSASTRSPARRSSVATPNRGTPRRSRSVLRTRLKDSCLR